MHFIESQRVYNKNIFRWSKYPYELIDRRVFAFLFTISQIFILSFICLQALVVNNHLTSPVIILFGFFVVLHTVDESISKCHW